MSEDTFENFGVERGSPPVVHHHSSGGRGVGSYFE